MQIRSSHGPTGIENGSSSTEFYIIPLFSEVNAFNEQLCFCLVRQKLIPLQKQKFICLVFININNLAIYIL